MSVFTYLFIYSLIYAFISIKMNLSNYLFIHLFNCIHIYFFIFWFIVLICTFLDYSSIIMTMSMIHICNDNSHKVNMTCAKKLKMCVKCDMMKGGGVSQMLPYHYFFLGLNVPSMASVVGVMTADQPL